MADEATRRRRRLQAVEGKVGSVDWCEPPLNPAARTRAHANTRAAPPFFIIHLRGTDASARPAAVVEMQQRLRGSVQMAPAPAPAPAAAVPAAASVLGANNGFTAGGGYSPESDEMLQAFRQTQLTTGSSAAGGAARGRVQEKLVVREAFQAESAVPCSAKRPEMARFLAGALSKCVMFEGLAEAQMARMIEAMEPYTANPRERSCAPAR